MYRLWVMGGLAAVLSAGNFGCYLDQLQAEQRANRVLREDLERTKSDLLAAEAMNRQKDTEIDALSKQMGAKNDMLASLNVENGKLRGSLTNAEDILKEMAGKPLGDSTVIVKREALPPALSNALKDFAAKYPQYVEFDPRTGTVRWKADLLFPLGSDQLSGNAELMEAMKKFAEIVNSSDAAGFDVVVVGHTCTTPIKKAETLAEHKTNWHLSAHRAISVMNLLSENGVNLNRLGVMGYGEFRPIADNSSSAGKSKNRRVEIYLVQKDSVQSFSQGVYGSSNQKLSYAKPAELASPPARNTQSPAKTTPQIQTVEVEQ